MDSDPSEKARSAILSLPQRTYKAVEKFPVVNTAGMPFPKNFLCTFLYLTLVQGCNWLQERDLSTQDAVDIQNNGISFRGECPVS